MVVKTMSQNDFPFLVQERLFGQLAKCYEQRAAGFLEMWQSPAILVPTVHSSSTARARLE